MDKAKILRMCNDIEDAVNELAACCETIDFHTHKMLIDKLRGIGAEITAQPKTNADRIRQMTDEELAESIGLACKRCAYCAGNKCTGQDKECAEGNLKWLKQEVSEGVTD